jgi:hypothetical protein
VASPTRFGRARRRPKPAWWWLSAAPLFESQIWGHAEAEDGRQGLVQTGGGVQRGLEQGGVCWDARAWRARCARRDKDGGRQAAGARTEYERVWRARRGVTLAQVFDLDLTRTEPREKDNERERKRERERRKEPVSREFTFKLTSCYFVSAALLALLAYSFRSNLCLRSHTATVPPKGRFATAMSPGGPRSGNGMFSISHLTVL